MQYGLPPKFTFDLGKSNESVKCEGTFELVDSRGQVLVKEMERVTLKFFQVSC